MSPFKKHSRLLIWWLSESDIRILNNLFLILQKRLLTFTRKILSSSSSSHHFLLIFNCVMWHSWSGSPPISKWWVSSYMLTTTFKNSSNLSTYFFSISNSSMWASGRFGVAYIHNLRLPLSRDTSSPYWRDIVSERDSNVASVIWRLYKNISSFNNSFSIPLYRILVTFYHRIFIYII